MFDVDPYFSKSLVISIARVTAQLYKIVKCLAIIMARVTALLYNLVKMLSHIKWPE